MSAKRVNILRVEMDESLDEAGFRHEATSVGRRLGAERVGASVYEPGAGAAIWPYHYHHGIEEWLYVIAGAPVLRDPAGERTLTRGDVVCFPRARLRPRGEADDPRPGRRSRRGYTCLRVASRGPAHPGLHLCPADGLSEELGTEVGPMSCTRLIGAVRDRMRSRPALERADRPPVAPAAAPRRPRSTPEPAHDGELERLAAEARYHRDRFDLYQARVRSGSSAATSLGRLRELERTATAAADRLADAQRVRRGAAK